MGQVRASTERAIGAPAERVREALADYTDTRPRILTEHFSEYRVETGGRGAGTRAHWKLAATSKRVRDCLVSVEEPAPGQLVERDANSSLVTIWTVEPAGGASSTVRVESTWNGAGGIGGFFERTFAPRGLARIYDGVLANLEARLRG